MIKKVVKKRRLNDPKARLDDLVYWMNRPAKERIAAVEYLRRQYYGNTARLQRVVRIIQQSQR